MIACCDAMCTPSGSDVAVGCLFRKVLHTLVGSNRVTPRVCHLEQACYLTVSMEASGGVWELVP